MGVAAICAWLDRFFAAKGVPLAAEVVDPRRNARVQYLDTDLDTGWEVMRNACHFMVEKLGVDQQAKDISSARYPLPAPLRPEQIKGF